MLKNPLINIDSSFAWASAGDGDDEEEEEEQEEQGDVAGGRSPQDLVEELIRQEAQVTPASWGKGGGAARGQTRLPRPAGKG